MAISPREVAELTTLTKLLPGARAGDTAARRMFERASDMMRANLDLRIGFDPTAEDYRHNIRVLGRAIETMRALGLGPNRSWTYSCSRHATLLQLYAQEIELAARLPRIAA